MATTLWVCGANGSGQLGDGSTTDSLVPKQIGSATWSAVGAGQHHSLAVKANGTLWACRGAPITNTTGAA
jgi:alpha-tubulin suppressor-like RCC1 family protein